MMTRMMIIGAAWMLMQATAPEWQTQVDWARMHGGYAPIVDAIQITVPAPYPCNLNHNMPGTLGPTSCLTGPEMHWTCGDKERVLLTSEDDKHYCFKVR